MCSLDPRPLVIPSPAHTVRLEKANSYLPRPCELGGKHTNWLRVYGCSLALGCSTVSHLTPPSQCQHILPNQKKNAAVLPHHAISLPLLPQLPGHPIPSSRQRHGPQPGHGSIRQEEWGGHRAEGPAPGRGEGGELPFEARGLAASAPISISCPLESDQTVNIYLTPRRIGWMMDCWQCSPIKFYLRPSHPADRR